LFFFYTLRRKLVEACPRKHESLHYQSPPQDLVQATLRRGEGRLSDTGALVVYTGAFTGRSPRDRFLVQDEITAGAVHWNYFNQPIDETHFLLIRKKIVAYLEKQP
jgi:phosphoenolpyruvate carboxykinase (ATP)